MTYELELKSELYEDDKVKKFKFDGGEIEVQLKEPEKYTACTHIQITTRLNSSDDIMTLAIVVNTIYKDIKLYSEVRDVTIDVIIPYFPYQQSDREFGIGRCMGVVTMTSILRYLPVSRYIVYMPHSESCINLTPFAYSIQDNKFIRSIITDVLKIADNEITLLTPDAGAYKRIGNLVKNINFTGNVASANKYRDLSSGDIESIQLSCDDFKGSDILIIDDICMGGRTFIGLAEKLKERNVGKIYLAVSHMIRQVINPLLLKHFDKIFTTNSRFSTYIYDTTSVTVNEYNERLYIYDIIKQLKK